MRINLSTDEDRNCVIGTFGLSAVPGVYADEVYAREVYAGYVYAGGGGSLTLVKIISGNLPEEHTQGVITCQSALFGITRQCGSLSSNLLTDRRLSDRHSSDRHGESGLPRFRGNPVRYDRSIASDFG